jgi:hypothetical protein
MVVCSGSVSRWPFVGLLVAVALATGACSSGPPPTDLTADEAARRLGTCSHRPDDWSGRTGLFVSAERWLEVRRSSPELRDVAAERPERHVDLTLLVQAYRHGVERVGSPHRETVALYGLSAPGVEWALRAGGRAYLALSSTGLERELESYVVVRHSDGSLFFVGDCAFDLLTGPMQERLGAGYGPLMEDLLGRTRDAVARVLGEHGFVE